MNAFNTFRQGNILLWIEGDKMMVYTLQPVSLKEIHEAMLAMKAEVDDKVALQKSLERMEKAGGTIRDWLRGKKK